LFFLFSYLEMSINSIVTAVAAYYAIGWVLDMLIQGGSLKISPDAAMAVQVLLHFTQACHKPA